MPPALTIPPDDASNRTLVANVHPPDWRNPTPQGRYHLAVVGGGTAGLVTAAVAASLGARVALVERHLLGGDCLNVGCVPSKAVIRAGRLAAEAHRARALGLPLAADATVDFGAAMARMRAVRARISSHDSARRFRDEFGVDVHLGTARFAGEGVLEVDRVPLRFARAVVATGARPAAPPVPGLAEAGFVDNESVFGMTERPARLAVVGGGPIGCELSQAFRRLGSRVTLVEQGPRLLPRDDADAAEVVRRAFEGEGIALRFGANLVRVERKGEERVLHLRGAEGGSEEIVADEILVAAGRAPNVEGLGLESVGVDFDRRGVRVDDRLRTTNPRIFAAGDVCLDWKFTHAADAAAKLVVQNALFFGRKRLSKLVVPWCTYTDPEVAHVGTGPEEARGRGVELDTFEVPMARVDRALTDGQEEGFVRVHTKRGSDRILGATVVSAHAGEMISELTLAMQQGIGLGRLVHVIHPYPTQAEAVRAVAALYTRSRLTPMAKRLLAAVLRVRR